MISADTLCGKTYLSGWILELFPYLKDPQAEEQFCQSSVFDETQYGTSYVEPQRFPNGFSEVPFKLQRGIDGQSWDMRLVGGLLGVAQDDDTLALRPEIGWAVCDDTPPAFRS